MLPAEEDGFWVVNIKPKSCKQLWLLRPGASLLGFCQAAWSLLEVWTHCHIFSLVDYFVTQIQRHVWSYVSPSSLFFFVYIQLLARIKFSRNSILFMIEKLQFKVLLICSICISSSQSQIYFFRPQASQQSLRLLYVGYAWVSWHHFSLYLATAFWNF